MIWGNQRVGGDALAAVALGTDAAWGTTAVVGTDVDNIVWGTNVLDPTDDVIWSPVRRNPQLPASSSLPVDWGVVELGSGRGPAGGRP